MKTRWIEKRQTSSHNNQDTFTKKENGRERIAKRKRKEERKAEKLSFHIIHNINRIFSFFLLI
jgi:hypothetical protein